MAKLPKENLHMKAYVKKSAVHKEGHHTTHSAAKLGLSSADAHRSAHHSTKGANYAKVKGTTKGEKRSKLKGAKKL